MLNECNITDVTDVTMQEKASFYKPPLHSYINTKFIQYWYKHR